MTKLSEKDIRFFSTLRKEFEKAITDFQMETIDDLKYGRSCCNCYIDYSGDKITVNSEIRDNYDGEYEAKESLDEVFYRFFAALNKGLQNDKMFK